jgi:F-type H+-transporting ATPase subunit b
MLHRARLCRRLVWTLPWWFALAAASGAQTGDAHAPAAASAAHAADEAHGGHAEDANPIESGTLANAISTLITFGVLLFILGKFVWPHVLKALKDRESFIRDSLTSARQEREEAQRLLSEYKTQLERARQDATRIVDEGRRDAEVVRRQIMDDARGEADATLKRAKREIEIARDTAVKDLYTMAGDLATSLSARILKKELDPAAHDRLIQEALDQLASQRNGK